jgi:hypothetical protein
LYEDLTVAENLRLYADLRDLPMAQRAGVFDELLTFTDLARFTARPAGKLSGGMKQKLGLACALLRKPRLLLLDEPCVGVDPISRRELWRMVTRLRDQGVGVVWSTAYLDEAEACDHVLLLNTGRVLFDGPPSALTARIQGRAYRMEGIQGRRRPVLTAVLDGYNAPVSCGNFLDLVLRGFYDGMEIQRNDGFVVQSGEFRGTQPPQRVEGSDTFVFASAQKGQALGKLTFDPGKGRGPVSDLTAAESDRQQLEFVKGQVSTLEGRLKAAKDPKAKADLERTMQSIRERQAALTRIVSVPPGARTMKLEWVVLNSSVADDPALKAEVLKIEPTYASN